LEEGEEEAAWVMLLKTPDVSLGLVPHSVGDRKEFENTLVYTISFMHQFPAFVLPKRLLSSLIFRSFAGAFVILRLARWQGAKTVDPIDNRGRICFSQDDSA
jgi:hypothetical protein